MLLNFDLVVVIIFSISDTVSAMSSTSKGVTSYGPLMCLSKACPLSAVRFFLTLFCLSRRSNSWAYHRNDRPQL